MSVMKVILVDDEKHALDALNDLLSEFEGIEVVEMFTNPLDAIELGHTLTYDVAFLDMEMPGLKGLETAEILSALHPSAEVVFITAYDSYAVEAFEIGALDYLLKPVSQKRMMKVMERIRARRGTNELASLEKDVQITCFGRFQIRVKGTHSEHVKWRTAKVKELMAYLVHRRGEVIHKDKIIETLWPDMDYEKTVANLHTCIYQIRKTLKEYGLSEQMKVIYLEDGYRLQLDASYCDLDLFMKTVSDSDDITKETLSVYEQVIELYGGDYFANEDYQWSTDLRMKFQLSYQELLMKVADYYRGEGNLTYTVKHLQRLIASNPLQEEYHERLLQVFAQMRDRDALHKHYETMRGMFLEELGIEPRVATRELFEQLSWELGE